ncbi:MAG: hypothetical protein IKO93_08585 [Lentisphaeria bacterium]|nr:hypothetical protein [Lentisphaeria bacterium]
MKKQKSQVGISQKNTIANAQEAKLIARQIVAKNDSGISALECMEQDTKYAGQITTYRINPETRDCEEIHRECNIRRISPLTVTVEIQEDKILIEVNYFAEGCLDCKQILAKMTVYARWDDDWYVWEHAAENGNLEAPYGRIYISEL